MIVIVGVPRLEGTLGVEAGEEIGDGDALGALVGAVAARRAGDDILGAENFPHLPDRLHLLGAEGLKVLHKADVVFHHLHIAHAREHHGDALEARRKADGVACGASAAERFQNLLGARGEVDEAAALDGLHDDDGLAEFAAHFVALVALDGSILIVHIVELDLHRVHFGIGRKDALQNFRFVVEGEPDAADLPLCFESKRRLIGAAALVFFKVVAILRVHEIEVEVLHAARFKLTLEEGADVLLFVEIVVGELIGENVFFAGIARGEAGFYRRLALPFDVSVRRVEIVEPCGKEGVHHLGEFFKVDFLPLHGKAHAAEAEILFDFGIENDFFHRCSLSSAFIL